MGQKIAKKLPKWQKTPIGPRRHVAKHDEVGQSVVTSILIVCNDFNFQETLLGIIVHGVILQMESELS